MKCSLNVIIIRLIWKILSLPHFLNTLGIISVHWLTQKKILTNSGRKRGTSQLNYLLVEDHWGAPGQQGCTGFFFFWF